MVTKHFPTPEEREERYVLPLPPEEAIEAVLAAGPHPADDPAVADRDDR